MHYTDTMMWKEIIQTPQVISSLKQTNEGVMKELLACIKKSHATNFVCAARGTSDHALVFFKYLLEIYSRYTVSLSAPSVITLYKGKIDYSNSIIIACSQSGMAEDVLQVIKKGNQHDAITIAITNDETSPIAREAKYHLFCNAGEEKSVGATKTFNAQLFLLLWLAYEVSKMKDEVKELDNINYEMEQLIYQIDKLTDVYSEKFKDMQNAFVLSRGITYSIALEQAIKLQELCYINAKGFPTSEFYHGPLAMVNDQTPIIMYCAKYYGDEDLQANVRADQIKCIQKLLQLKAPVILITNDAVLTGKFKKCNDALINVNIPEEFMIFPFSLFAQMFALKLSCKIGNDPDNPRSVDKIVK